MRTLTLAEPRRRAWSAGIVGAALVHAVLAHAILGAAGAAISTDFALVGASGVAVASSVIAARRANAPHVAKAWWAIAGGVGLWCAAATVWTFREAVLGDIAPPPSWFDVPFFALAPSFLAALLLYRRDRPSRALQIRQLADIAILVATIVLLGVLVLSEPIRRSNSDPYLVVALGYPALYLAIVLAAFTSLVGRSWGGRRVVLGLLVCAHLLFAIVDLLYGAKVLVASYQTGIEDTLWLIGMLGVAWAAREEVALARMPDVVVDEHASRGTNAIVGAAVVLALGALSAKQLATLGGLEWTLVALAIVALAAAAAVRVWATGQLEDSYERTLEEAAARARTLGAEREKLARLRGVAPLAGGTAHEVNNLLQAIAGHCALLRRRAARGEPFEVHVAAIEAGLASLANEVATLRKVAPATLVVVLLPDADPDGQLARTLADAGYAPAMLPTPEAALRAIKSGDVHAIVASSAEAAQLSAARATVPVIVRDGDLLEAIVEIVTKIG